MNDGPVTLQSRDQNAPLTLRATRWQLLRALFGAKFKVRTTFNVRAGELVNVEIVLL